jgi:hypothetical protein
MMCSPKDYPTFAHCAGCGQEIYEGEEAIKVNLDSRNTTLTHRAHTHDDLKCLSEALSAEIVTTKGTEICMGCGLEIDKDQHPEHLQFTRNNRDYRTHNDMDCLMEAAWAQRIETATRKAVGW